LTIIPRHVTDRFPKGLSILVTGAAGFVGRHLVRHLADRHRVHAVVRTETEFDADVNVIVHDLSTPIGNAFPDRVDGVIHLAQSPRYRDFPEGASDVFAINVASTFQLLEYARRAGAASFVFTSTGGVYGYSYERFVETDPVSPLNFYFSSKYSAELLIANYQAFFNTVVLRIFFAYGPGQEGMLVPSLIDRVLRGETVTVEGDPGLRINPLYIDDVIRVFEPALAARVPAVVNVAGDEPVTITRLTELIGEAAGVKPRIGHTGSDAGGDLLGDNRQMRTTLGASPRVPLAEGLRRTVRALRSVQ